MQQLLPYLVKSVLVSGVLTAYYLIALRNRRFHAYNRAYLLSVLVVSLLLPLVHIPWQPFAGVARTTLTGLVTRGPSAGHAAATPWYSIALFAGGVAVSLVLLGMLSWRVFQTYRLGFRQDVQRIDGYTIVETDDPRAPFSFFSTLFWRRGAALADPVNQKILQHELAHIHGRHGWDSLFAQLAVCLFWMNPSFWFIRKELTMVHEFIADTAAEVEGDTEGFARMLLQSIYAGRFLEPAHSFFQSPIKRRLMMISQHRSGGLALVRKAFVLPILGAVIVIVSCSKGQVSKAPDALAQVKLEKLQRDSVVRIVYLTLDKPNSEGAKQDSVRLDYTGEKAALELKLQKAEADENFRNAQVVPDR